MLAKSKEKIIQLALSETLDEAHLTKILKEGYGAVPHGHSLFNLMIVMPDGRYLLEHVAQRYGFDRVKALIDIEMRTVDAKNNNDAHYKNWKQKVLAWALAIELANDRVDGAKDPFFRKDIFTVFHQRDLPIDEYHWETYPGPVLQLLACSAYSERRDFFIKLLGIDYVDFQGWTLAHYTARFGYDFVMRKVLHCHPNLELTTPNGDTPLHLAAIRGDFKVVKVLLDAGASPLEKNKQDKTAKEIAEYSMLHRHEGIYLVTNEIASTYALLEAAEKSAREIEALHAQAKPSSAVVVESLTSISSHAEEDAFVAEPAASMREDGGDVSPITSTLDTETVIETNSTSTVVPVANFPAHAVLFAPSLADVPAEKTNWTFPILVICLYLGYLLGVLFKKMSEQSADLSLG